MILSWILPLWAALMIAVSTQAKAEEGAASYYTRKSSGSTMANGKPLNDGAFTAAHKKLPFGTRVRVTNKRNGKSIIVTITDRGPFIRGRIIDLTAAGMRALAMGGVAPVKVEVVR